MTDPNVLATRLDAFQCGTCPFEFVVVCLNRPQQWTDTPYCPACGRDDEVHKIDCLDFRITEGVQQYEILKGLKPIPPEKPPPTAMPSSGARKP